MFNMHDKKLYIEVALGNFATIWRKKKAIYKCIFYLYAGNDLDL